MNEKIIHCPSREIERGQFTDGGEVLLTGKVFELGDYPDRNFSIAVEEMDAAIAAFKPIPNDLEHSRLRDVLGNSLGELRRIWRQGNEVFGEVSAPAWLVNLAGKALKVSLAFNSAKQVVGNALTLSPRISDAEVVAAFTGRRHSESDMKDIQAIHDLAVEQGAQCEAKFSIRGWLRGLLLSEGHPSIPPVRTPAPGDCLPRFEEAAARFADSAIRDGKFVPAERESLRKVFLAALSMDSCGGLTTFNDVEPWEGDACFALRQLVESARSHELGREVLSGNHTILRSDGISEERKKELLGKTDLGREVTRARTRAQ